MRGFCTHLDSRTAFQELNPRRRTIIEADPHCHFRYALRWLRRLLEEHGGLTLEEAALAESALAALAGLSTDQAYLTLFRPGRTGD